MLSPTGAPRLERALVYRERAHGYARHWRRLLDADELVSCADLALCEAAAKFDGRGDFSGWLYTNVRRVVIATLRRDSGDLRDPARPKFIPTEPWRLERVTVDVDPVEALDLAQRLRRMPRRMAQMTLLRHEGYELREIGRVFGVSPSRVCQLVHEGWRSLEP